MRSAVVAIGALNLDVVAGYGRDDSGLPMANWGRDEERAVSEHDWWRIFYAYLSGREIHLSPGGSAANTGAALAALDSGLSVTITGLIGEDAEAEHLNEDKFWFGVRREFSRVPEGRTGRALSYVGHPPEGRRLAVAPGVNDRFQVSRVADAVLASASWLHTSSFVDSACNRELAGVMKRARALNSEVTISLDPGTFLSQPGSFEVAPECLSEADYILTKTSELTALANVRAIQSEEAQRRQAVQMLFAMSSRPLTVVVERIPNGFTIYRSDGSPPQSIDFEQKLSGASKDDTGAGDVFDAGFIYSVIKGLAPLRAVRLIRSLLQVHLSAYGRSGYEEFSSCTPIIFASHSAKDRRLVHEFVDQLKGTEVSFWLDEAEMPLGGSLREQIRHGIRESDAVAAFITPDSMASGWVRSELAWAREEGRRIIPIMLVPTQIPADLADTYRLDRSTVGAAEAREHLLREFRRGKPSITGALTRG